MKVAVVGLGYTGRATVRGLLELGTTDILQADDLHAGAATHPDGSPAELSATWLAEADVCILAADSIDIEHCLAVNATCVAAGVPLIPGLGMGDVAQVGPVVHGGAGPCLQCIDLRVQVTLGRPALVGPYPTNPALADVVGRTLATKAHATIDDQLGTWADNPITYLWSNGTSSQHHALRVQDCPTCGGREPLPAFAVPRTLDLDGDRGYGPSHILELMPRLVDDVMGVVRWIQPYLPDASEPQIAHAVASIADPAWSQAGLDVFAGGNDIDADRARGAALGEALDRLGTSEPGRRHLRIETYATIADDAVDPARFDLFHPETRQRRGFPYPAAGPGAPTSWIWGWSMAGACPKLIPAARVFVPFTPVAVGDQGVPANVSGSATGTSLAEAALGGLLEVIERDAFMIAWATRLPVTGVIIDEASPSGIGPYVRAFRQVGIQVRCSTVTLDWGIPLAIAIAKPDGPAQPATVIAAAADSDLATACRRALKELTANLAHVRNLMQQGPRPVSVDPTQVRTQDAHALLYARHDMAEHLESWWSPPASMTPSASEGGPPRDVLASIASRIVDGGGDVLLVDLSLPGLSESGLWTVKALVPEAYPMNFDALWPQVGGRRMSTAPVDAGLLDDPVPFQELNAVPHPFP